MKQQDQPSHANAPAEGTPQYASLGDYVRMVRRHRVLIALVTLGVGVLALAYSLSQSTEYKATATMVFRDVLQDFNIVGGDVTSQEPPAERALRNADLITRPEVARAVRKQLKADLSSDELASAIDAEVEAQTNNVNVEAEWGNAKFAAKLANAFAEQAKRVGTREELARVNDAAEQLSEQVQEARKRGSGVPGLETAPTFGLQQLENQLAQVQILQRVAEPIRILRMAEVPGSPASPKPVRNTVLGLMIGLIFGLIAAFVRESLDRRLRNVHEVHQALELPVLGRVSHTALGSPGLTNALQAMPETEFEGFRVLRMNLAALGNGSPPRSVLVTSGLPEEGKTTVSVSLACAGALAGQRVLLVEGDLRKPTFARRFGVESSPGLTDYLAGTAGPQDILQVVPVAEPMRPTRNGASPEPDAGSIICITAGSALSNGAELLSSERFATFLEKVSKAYDLTIIDSSPLLAVVDALEITPHVDCVLVCARVQRTTRDEAAAARSALGNLPERPMGAVATGLRRGGPDSYDYYYGY